MLTQRAIQLIAEAKIDSAIKRGEFDKLPGVGKPFEFDELNFDPNGWIRRKIELEKLNSLKNVWDHES